MIYLYRKLKMARFNPGKKAFKEWLERKAVRYA